MENLAAAQRVVEALRDLGRLEAVDDARVQSFLGLARAVDENPGSASLWAQYRDSEVTLRGAGDSRDALADLFASLRDSEDV